MTSRLPVALHLITLSAIVSIFSLVPRVSGNHCSSLHRKRPFVSAGVRVLRIFFEAGGSSD